MKAITLCLLVLVSASCVLSASLSSNGVDSFAFDDEQIDLLLAELESGDDQEYMDIESYGFILSCKKILIKALKGIRGTNCILKEVVAVLKACTDYVDAIDKCGVAVPKDVANILSSVKSMITICNNIIHANSTYCNTTAEAEADASSRTVATSAKCFTKVFVATMKLVRKINVTLKLIAKLPSDTSSCFVNATNAVKYACDNFLPKIDLCIDSM
ncbi:uncharacterized protein Dwil_GK25812 [Drosophila willistoni]|uniref:Protein TsetseEP domain-containing protein n=1 Tax=Drosophila willistoni TaxID=7260 RepID=B4NC86_DROWI|nr:uncharacterized protein LOC6648930 [Drosophila willistoni]EDW82445.1 uncharacterized protein Dwil_GK25812 [Drosophila willistoni]